MSIIKLTLQLLLSFCFSTLIFSQDKLSKGDHFAPINNIKIHYYVSGNGPICLVPTPGWGPSMDYLRNSLTPFEKYFTVVYYDTRMSGQSTGPEDPTQYTSQHFINDMDSLRAYLEQPKVWIMGHSSGGFQVLYYGIHHSDKLHGIIAIDAIAGHDSLYHAEYRRLIMQRKGQPFFEKGAKILLREDTTYYKTSERMQLTTPFYFHDPKKMADFQKLGEMQISSKAQRYSEASKMGLEYIFPELNKITVPTLVIVGDDDFVCNKVSQADRIVKKIENATELVIKDAGHFPWIEQPEQFFNECGNWLRKQGLKEQN